MYDKEDISVKLIESDSEFKFSSNKTEEEDVGNLDQSYSISYQRNLFTQTDQSAKSLIKGFGERPTTQYEINNSLTITR